MKDNNNNIKDKDLQDDERISSYIRGEMTESEETDFINDLQSDDDLRSKAVDTAYLTKALRDVGKEQDTNVKEALMSVSRENVEDIASYTVGRDNRDSQKTKMEMAYCDDVINEELTPEQLKLRDEWYAKNEKERKRRMLRRRIITALSTAACLCILCIVGVQYHGYRTTTGLGEQYAGTFIAQQESSIRGVESTTSKELAKLYNNVQQGTDLDATIQRLTVLWEVSTLDTYNDYTEDAPLIGWNLVIANLKNNDKKAAKSVLEELIRKTENGNAVNDKSKELLKRLK